MSQGYKVVITKVMSQDEQLQCEVLADTKEGLRLRLTDALEILDARMVQQGMRVVAAMKDVQTLPPAVQQVINATFGVLFGRPGARQELATANEFLAKAGITHEVSKAEADAELAKLEREVPE